MNPIRKISMKDISRLAEILIFTKRVHYRSIFHDDKVSFGEMQVLPLAQEYLKHPDRLENIWVYDDEFVKGILHIEKDEIVELYVDPFFQKKGIGSSLIKFAIDNFSIRQLWVLEKNSSSIQFYLRHGFMVTNERNMEEGTTEYVVKMIRDVD